jgi:hypothetical protein
VAEVMEVANTLAYCGTATITGVKCFVVEAAADEKNLFFNESVVFL